jgi:raffinose/stachyose/melibiose transport system substrate-binding protein
MKRPSAGKILNGVGLILLATCFLYATGRILFRTAEEADPDTRILRFAHWQLEAGIREAFDALARDYEALHPGVEIRQVTIPETIWRNWTTTQLVGGTAPDLIQIGRITTSQISRFFRPITEYVDQPNPYNVGTELEGVPWRNTYRDNLETTYNRELMDYYGVSPFAATVRAYYNLDLLRKYTGRDTPPQDLAEFLEVCEMVRTRSAAEGRVIYPIAGSNLTGYVLFDRVTVTQTQRLAVELNPTGSFPILTEDFFLAYLTGRWSFTDPPLQDTFRILRRLAREMTPGFLSLSRDDATFYFLQGRTLMIPTGSYDVSSIFEQATFPVAVAPLPTPGPDHPRYGRNMIDTVAEGGVRMNGPFGITYGSPHPDLALDFLRFLSSQKANQKFSRISRWLPVIRGVEVDDVIKPFMPRKAGFPQGVYLRTGSEVRRVTETQMHQLVSGSKSTTEFAESVSGPYRQAMKRDLETIGRRWQRNVMRDDSTFGAYEFLAAAHPTDPEFELRSNLVSMSQARQEVRSRDMARQLATVDQAP